MNGYEKLKNISEYNWYLNDLSKRVFSFHYNRMMKCFVNEICQVDSILHIEEFAEKLKQLPDTCCGTSYTYKRAYSENTLYGYAEEILKYAGISPTEVFYFPLLEHGIAYQNYIDTKRYNTKSAYIFQGRYKEELWSSLNHKKKTYYIGPYIHYCNSFYQTEKIDSLKKKWGKTLLVFLPHSTEYERIYFDVEELLNNFYKKSTERFQTVLICVFWADINDELIKKFNQKNIQLVSAGFKLDPFFVRRLRTILQLADTVLYTSFSSSIGYAYYLNRKIVYDITLEQDSMRTRDRAFSKQIDTLFMKCFSIDDVAEEKKFALVDKYWGLSEIKPPEAVRDILMENKKNIRFHLGF